MTEKFLFFQAGVTAGSAVWASLGSRGVVGGVAAPEMSSNGEREREVRLVLLLSRPIRRNGCHTLSAGRSALEQRDNRGKQCGRARTVGGLRGWCTGSPVWSHTQSRATHYFTRAPQRSLPTFNARPTLTAVCCNYAWLVVGWLKGTDKFGCGKAENRE